MAVMALPRREPDDKFDQWATFAVGVGCGVVLTMFLVWLAFEFVL
jgi:hypothetical protein